ncbi:putative surface protease GP63, putative,metallopeptidase [Trypanosoma theileri]|uniref:Leishmanolysin-like peptidase n=1 Tax=Trypanosoma theileri TaxID=67003 RepID=A0A1X0NVW1_9TRYP|nr:putative surface protease GP63, putative,metallopeptidase [Trypanosoma theileri]ORC88349.1 putative surface protease GP63, putative,metallopeptidase [Trypanosoma theileri]
MPDKCRKMFCDEIKPALQCTSDRFALGMCSKEGDLHKFHVDYFLFSAITTKRASEWTDGYPIIKAIPQTNCEKGQLKYMTGSVVGKESRCLKGEDLTLKMPSGKPPVGDICADVKCENNKLLVKYSGSNAWQECKDGKINVTGSSEFTGGSILCPNYTEVCNNFTEIDVTPIKYDDDEKKKWMRRMRKRNSKWKKRL